MSEQIPQPQLQPQKKGLSKGCTVALIIGGVVVVLIAAVIILFIVKGKDMAKWAYVKAVESEKTYIMNAGISGIDTVAINQVADGFKARVEAEDFELVSAMSFQAFVQGYATDMNVDSAEAEAFVSAMIDCYPELESLYNPELMEAMPDTMMMEGDSQ